MSAFEKANPRPIPVSSTPDAYDPTEYYEPAEFAVLAKVPVSRVLAFVRAKAIHPAIPGGGRSNKTRFHKSQVEEVQRLYRNAASVAEKERFELAVAGMEKGKYTGDEAKLCFASFAGGATIRQCVIEHGIHPQTVLEIRKAYASIDGFVLISRSALEKIEALPIDGPMPITSDAELIAVLAHAVESTQCRACRTRPKAYCKMCVQKEKIKTKSEAEATFRKMLSDGAKAAGVAPPAYPAPPAPSPAATTQDEDDDFGEFGDHP